jgi:hypothetical protein
MRGQEQHTENEDYQKSGGFVEQDSVGDPVDCDR